MFQSEKVAIKRGPLITGISYIASEKIACPPECALFLRSFYKTPRHLGYIPLDVVYLRQEGGVEPMLRTRSWKISRVPVSLFDYQNGYSLAPSVESALFGRHMEGLMEEMIR